MDKEQIINAVVFYLLESTQPLSNQEARAKAEAAIAIIERQAVKNHYRAIASRTNAKKGFGSNKVIAGFQCFYFFAGSIILTLSRESVLVY